MARQPILIPLLLRISQLVSVSQSQIDDIIKSGAYWQDIGFF
jgi:hypothetical protein